MEKKIQRIASLNTSSFAVHLDEVRLADGETGKRVKIEHPEVAAIIPFLSEDEIIMVRQFRYALGKMTLEVPAGKFDPGETAQVCAKRELMEETGYEAGEMRHLCTFAPAIGYSNELIHLYSGKDLKKRGRKTDDREIDSVEIISLKELDRMIGKGLILDAKTLIGLSLIRGRAGISY